MPLSEEKKKQLELQNSISETSSNFHTLNSLVGSLNNLLPLAKEAFQGWGRSVQSVNLCLKGHYHIDHSHGRCHSFDSTPPSKCWEYSPGKSKIINKCPQNNIPAVTVLIDEYNYWEDRDMNGMAFGRDFLFDPTDKSVPFALKQIQSTYISLFQYKPLITWKQFLKLCDSACSWNDKLKVK